MYNVCIYPTFDGHVDNLHVITVTDGTAMNNLAHFFETYLYAFPSDTYLSVALVIQSMHVLAISR